MIIIARNLKLEIAHFLPSVPAGHKCGRMHGHNLTVELRCEGEPDEETGWVVDYYDVTRAWEARVFAVLDHRLLNEVPGLHNPTTENVAMWIWSQLKGELPALCAVTVYETPDFGCIYDGHRVV